MKVYSCPPELPEPTPDYMNFSIDTEIAHQEEHKAKLKEWLVGMGYTGSNTGGIASFGVADGSAQYMFGDGGKGKSVLIHLKYFDGYHYQHIEQEQDAAMLVRGLGPKTGNPFVKKGLTDNARVAAQRKPVFVAMEKRDFEANTIHRNKLDSEDKTKAFWKRHLATAMNRRTVETGMSLRIRRVATLAKQDGIICVEVEPRGTTQDCSRCNTVVPKGLGDRWHECPNCGLSVGRDLNGSWNILGRALRMFHSSADPGGMIAAGIEERVEARLKADKKTELRREFGFKRRGKKKLVLGGVVAPEQNRLETS